MTTLKQKLIRTNLFNLTLLMAVFGSTAYIGLKNLSQQFTNLMEERSQSVKESYQRNSEENIRKIQSIFEESLRNKGSRLLTKDSVSLAPMIADNSFIGVQRFLQKTMEGDKDIVLATYFQYENGTFTAWYFGSSNLKEGLSSPTRYSQSKGGWDGITHEGHKVFIPDPSLEQLLSLREPKVSFHEVPAVGDKAQGFDCVIPFVDGKTGQAVQLAKNKGLPIGFLRYILSPSGMRKSIETEEAHLNQKLKELEQENQNELTKSREIGERDTKTILLFLGLSGLLTIIIAIIFAQISATRISNPVKILTKIAENIGKGQYHQEIALTSDDEIGVLARAFQEMSHAIQKRDDELAGINRDLEKTVELRTQEFMAEKIKGAHAAGMAEIATGVIHNIGNILTSVGTNLYLLDEGLRKSKLSTLIQGAKLLQEHKDNWGEFITKNPKGPLLLQLYIDISGVLTAENQDFQDKVRTIQSGVKNIGMVVATQQEYAQSAKQQKELRQVSKVIEEALRLRLISLETQKISVLKTFEEVPAVLVQEYKLLNVFVNLIKNGEEAMVKTPPDDRILRISVSQDEKSVIIKFTDNGYGISPENIQKIFNHGFTTKSNGHGFGLHAAANAMTEMGGQLQAESPGVGKGATFVVSLPKPKGSK